MVATVSGEGVAGRVWLSRQGLMMTEAADNQGSSAAPFDRDFLHVAHHHVERVGAWVQIDPDPERAETLECAHLAAQPRADTKHRLAGERGRQTRRARVHRLLHLSDDLRLPPYVYRADLLDQVRQHRRL